MQAGQSYPVTVTFKNTGTMTWEPTVGGHDFLLYDYPNLASTFGLYQVTLPTGTSVSPGQSYTFSFTMVAPTTGGTYTQNYRLAWKSVMWVGQLCTKQIVVTVPAPNSEFVSDTIPTSMQAGQSYPVTVTFKNTGTMTWEPTVGGHDFLLYDYPNLASTFGLYQVTLPTGTSISPGQSYTFSFTMVAPTTGGTYTQNYRLAWRGVMWVGQLCTKQIQVIK